MMKTVGIIGYGSFGSFLSRKLQGMAEISVFDPHIDVPESLDSDLVTIARCDYVVLAIPVDAYDIVLPELQSLLGDDSVVVDISSVKTVPVDKISKYLPSTKRVIMHPLFGPQSAEESYDGHVVVMCPEVSDSIHYANVKKFVLGLGLKVVEMTPEEHDQEMAAVHALTFFVSRTLLQMGVHDSMLKTPTFSRILDLADLEKHHSEDLFRTIQLANPYAEEVRKKFIQTATRLNESLAE